MVVKYNSLRLIRCCVDKSTGMKRLSKVVSAEILRCKTFHHKRLKLQTVHEWSGEEDHSFAGHVKRSKFANSKSLLLFVDMTCSVSA